MSLDSTREDVDGLHRRGQSLATIPLVFAAVAGLLTVGIYLTRGASAAWAIGLASTVILGLIVTASIRKFMRNQIEDDLLTNLPEVMGWGRAMDRSMMQCRRWQGGFRGYPSRITVAYSATRRIEDIAWQIKVKTEILRIIPNVQLTLAPHPSRHLKLVINASPLPPVTDETSATALPLNEHIATVMTDLFKAEAEVEITPGPQEDEPHEILVKHHRGNDMAMRARRAAVERIVAARLPGAWRAEWDLINNEVAFTRRPPLPRVCFPPSEHQAPVITHKDYIRLTIPLGVTEGGEEVFWRPKEQPHLLVSGPTNGGKTTVEHHIIERLAQAGCKIWLCDGKRIEFIGFRGWPNVELIAARTEHKVRMVQAFFEEMNRRYALIESGKARVADLEPLFLILDEAATLAIQAQMWFGEVKPKGIRSSKVPLMDWLGDIARLARSAKMHMLTGLQRPDVQFLGGEMRDNYVCRVSVGKLGPDGAQMMWGNPHTGAGPSPVPGRGWATTLDGRVVETQFYYAPNPDPARDEYEPSRVNAVIPSITRHAQKHIEILEPEATDIDGETAPLDFHDYMAARILDGPDPTWGSTPDHQAMAEAEQTEFIIEPASNQEPTGTEEDHDFEPDLEDSEEQEQLFAGYETQQLTLSPSQLHEGYLIQAEEELCLWGVIETLGFDDTGIEIDYRVLDTGEPGCITLDESTTVQVRVPIADPTDTL